MRKMVPIVFLLIAFSSLFCEFVSQEDAQRISTIWFSNRSGETEPVIGETFSVPGEEHPAFYVFNYEPDGFVIVSADDATYPILGYSMETAAPAADDHPAVRWMHDNFVNQIEVVRSSDLGNTLTRPIWNLILARDFASFGFTRDVSPLITSNWDQDYPFNGDCPNDSNGPGGHAYAGCGATAMGQIMNFWEHPAQGTGAHSYVHPDYGTISANFGETTYNWGSMPNSIYSYDGDIAELLYHCGVSSNMDYGPDGSGSNSVDTQYAFATYFGYQNTIQLLYKEDYTDSVWNTLIINQLEVGKPLFYAGYGEYGHAFVLDGYEGTAHFHFNWGWSGSYNGYFYLNNLNPGYYNFTSNQQALVNIVPAEGPGDGDPPTNLTATIENDEDIRLNWLAPTGEPAELRWDDGVNYNGIGSNSATTFDVAIRFDTDDLAGYNGLTLTEVSFYPRYEDCEYTVKVWAGGSVSGSSANEGELLTEQYVDNLLVNTWNTAVLDYPVQIDASEELWIGYEADTQGDHPAGCSQGPAVAWKGDLIKMGSWASLSTEYPNLDYNWNIVGYATSGRESERIELAQGSARNERDLTGYKVYRDGNMVHEITDINTLTWTDENLEEGVYTYWVTAVYNSTEESNPSNSVIAEIEGDYPAPENLFFAVNGDDILFQWSAPGVDDPVYEFIEEGFEDTQFIEDWYWLDVDGDSYYWEIAPYGFTPNSGDFCMASASFINEVGPLTPDNWLITPAVNLYQNAFMAFYVSPQDEEWVGEHFEVWLSTSGVNPLNFTDLLYEETITDNDWYQVYLDLGDYAGETVHIAFVHNEVTDMYWLKLDDVFICSPVRNINGDAVQSMRESRKNDGVPHISAAIPSAPLHRDRPELTGYNMYRDYVVIGSTDADETYYEDADIPNGLHVYYVTAVYEGGHESGPSNSVDIEWGAADEIPEITNSLRGNYPNPFNPTTRISFSIAQTVQVKLDVFNLKGQLVKTLVREKLDSGNHSVQWNGDDNSGKAVGSGIYFYRLQAGNFTQTQKMVLIK